jgi:hypothetical protein
MTFILLLKTINMTIEILDEIPPVTLRVGIVSKIQANKALEIL